MGREKTFAKGVITSTTVRSDTWSAPRMARASSALSGPIEPSCWVSWMSTRARSSLFLYMRASCPPRHTSSSLARGHAMNDDRASRA